MAEQKTPEQLLKEAQAKLELDQKALQDQLAQLKKDKEAFEAEKAEFDKSKADFDTDLAQFEEDKKTFVEQQANAAKDAADVEDSGSFEKDGYLVLHDLMYKGKILPPGTRNKLAELKKPQIDRLLNEKQIRK